jgi:hypothetical protein
MAESILDRLDRDPGGARQYVATLLVAGGASRAQVADALARKYSIPAPTGRSITEWKNHDPELRTLIAEMETAKRDLRPGDDPTDLLPREVNQAQAASDLFGVCIHFPAFALLMERERETEDGPDGADTRGAFEQFDPPPAAADDPDSDSDVLAVLIAGHETAEAFEADCLARLGDYSPTVEPTPGAGRLAGYEPVADDPAD